MSWAECFIPSWMLQTTHRERHVGTVAGLIEVRYYVTESFSIFPLQWHWGQLTQSRSYVPSFRNPVYAVRTTFNRAVQKYHVTWSLQYTPGEYKLSVYSSLTVRWQKRKKTVIGCAILVKQMFTCPGKSTRGQIQAGVNNLAFLAQLLAMERKLNQSKAFP